MHEMLKLLCKLQTQHLMVLNVRRFCGVFKVIQLIGGNSAVKLMLAAFNLCIRDIECPGESYSKELGHPLWFNVSLT